MENQEKTQEVEVKETETATPAEVETVEAAAEPAKPKEETIGEALGTTEKTEDKTKSDTVPLSVFLEMKKDNKKLERDFNELKKSIEGGASKKEISSDLKALAEEHGVDKKFLQDFANNIKTQMEAETEAKISEKLKPITEKDKKTEIDSKFNTLWDKLLVENPEYKDIANKEVIKTLALNPQNSNKAFSKILEEAYGHLITGKKSIENSTPRGGKNDNQEIDFGKARSDPAYFSEIMSNPTLKAKYNADLEKRVLI